MLWFKGKAPLAGGASITFISMTILHSYPVPGVNLSVFPLFLASPTDYRFDKWKSLSVRVSDCFRQSVYLRVFDRMVDCGQVLTFGLSSTGSFILTSAHFCLNRLCPLCSWRRRLFWQARLSKAFSALVVDRPDIKFIFLTLACRNCELEELGATIKQLSLAWRVLTGSSRSSIGKHWPGLGYLRVFEITRELRSDGSSRCHPHIHACIPVPESYFYDRDKYLVQNSEDSKQLSRNYSGRPGWVQLWQEALKVDYLPTAHVKPVKSSNEYILGANLRETLKYVVKPSSLIFKASDFSSNVYFLESIYSQLSGVRMISSGGVVREYLRKYTEDSPDCEELINVSGDTLTDLNDSASFNFKWFEYSSNIRFRPTRGFYSAVDSSFNFLKS